MDPKIKLCICKVMSNAVNKTGCTEVSGTVSVDDSHMFITTYMLTVSQHSRHYQANTWSVSTNTHTQPKREKTLNSPTMGVKIRAHCITAVMRMKNQLIKKWDTRVSLKKFLGHQSITLKNRTNGNPKWAVETGFTWFRLWSNDRLLWRIFFVP
jgi:hypothetical protein